MRLTAGISPWLQSLDGPAAAKADATQRRAVIVATDLPSACEHGISMFETFAAVHVGVSVNKRVTHTIYTHPNSPGLASNTSGSDCLPGCLDKRVLDR